MSVQIKLEEAVTKFGLNDIVTIMLSQKRDKEIVIRQREIYNRWKEKNCSGNNC
ncbi:hypothetical protein H8S10_15470 [Clostridium sp. NSJ-49]|uniref:hypothetical protein n=1 Tax=Clostridium TaxID=1485 RepID=UPI00164BF288|nr:hypothetical protein [Clostridium sp. NSJ-49]MBC5624730.1 hypothetical protein [Clostridium sp. NSJ-49]MBC5626841.1 hypothetical protein [Clostridium sp. NSJ-49]